MLIATHRFRFSLVMAAIVIVSGLRAGDDQISQKKSQLDKLRKEISEFENKIRDRETKEKSTLELLDSYDRQATLLRTLIQKLREEERSIQSDITETRRSIDELNGQIRHLKEHYARYVVNAYKTGRTYDLELLLTAHSFNQLLVRSEYLRRFSDQRRADRDRMESKRSTLDEQRALLERQLAEERRVIAEKSLEERKLLLQVQRRKTILADIRKDKKNFQREIDRKKQSIKDLEQMITRLIEEDRLRKEREARLARERGSTPPPPSASAVAFEARRGSLRWPVSQGKIVGRFGNQQHPVLRTITQNTGIDISVTVGTDVDAIADGEISTIWWLPSFGNLVIVNHRNGYRTVYAHLSEIVVNEGDVIREGGKIGRSGESLAGPMLHFEIWKDRDKQDPELWLHPRGLTQR
jgi:septal ring factor EnvC (AmiA/AmiB activator)